MRLRVCIVCEKNLSVGEGRRLSDGDRVCLGCFNKAETLTPKQILFTKNVTSEELIQSIKDSGNTIERHDPSTEFSELQKPKKKKRDKNIVACPNCDSTNVHFIKNDRKGFSIGKALGGAVLTGGIGALAGFAGKKGKDQWHCGDCGHAFLRKRIK